MGVAPIASSFAVISGVFTEVLIAWFKRFTSSGGKLRGPKTPHHTATKKSFMPCSAKVGTSGKVLLRVVLAVPNTLTLPLCKAEMAVI